MMMLEFRVGDTCWIHEGQENGTNPLVEGEVVHVFTLWGMTHYVVSLPSFADPVLLVRTGLSMSDAADKPIGLWRR